MYVFADMKEKGSASSGRAEPLLFRLLSSPPPRFHFDHSNVMKVGLLGNFADLVSSRESSIPLRIRLIIDESEGDAMLSLINGMQKLFANLYDVAHFYLLPDMRYVVEDDL